MKRCLLCVTVVMLLCLGISCSSSTKDRAGSLEHSLRNTLVSMVNHYYSADLWNACQIIEQIAEVDNVENQETLEHILDKIEVYNSYGNMSLSLLSQQQMYLTMPILSDEIMDTIDGLRSIMHEYFSLFSDRVMSGGMPFSKEFSKHNLVVADQLKHLNVSITSLGDGEAAYIGDLDSVIVLIDELVEELR